MHYLSASYLSKFILFLEFLLMLNLQITESIAAELILYIGLRFRLHLVYLYSLPKSYIEITIFTVVNITIKQNLLYKLY